MAGIVFISVGVFAVLSPQSLANMLGMDAESVKLMGYALGFAGFSDFIIAKVFQSKS